MTELPLAGTRCALDSEGADRQGRRYAELAGSLTHLDRQGLKLTAGFGPGLDEELMRETIEVERSCCSFFAIAFDPSRRQLELAVPSADYAPALDLVHSALTRMGAWGGSTS